MKKILTVSQIQLPRLIGSLVGGMIGLTIVFFLMKQNEMDLVFFLIPLIFSYPSFEFAVNCNTSRRQLVKIVIGSVFLTSIILLGIVLLYMFIFKYQFVIAGSKVTGSIDYLYFYFLTLTAQLTSLVINMDSRLGYWSKVVVGEWKLLYSSQL
ncbi:hypothetical protein [Holzapfeliella floricola]|uniref:hypothetical protein n=1 Tax=Holzapfeliella floricola TaxID=679249 RepID=UPI000781EF88|nr:hypothetical protein [Holzapfeliella floricola]